MTDFATKVAEAVTTPPDPHKHVNYAVGMVLGVDDFTQEFTYLSALNQWLARDLIGYGTVTGLQVSLTGTNPVTATSNPQINVSAGVAVTPQGQFVRIVQDQCANINDWLATIERKDKLNSMFGTATSGNITTYVVLCYNNLPTDEVPIPGEPCRDEKDILRPSRLSDDFGLELRLIDSTVTPPVTPPDQKTEEAVRAFVALLKQVQLVSSAPSVDATQFETVLSGITVATPSPLTYKFGPPALSTVRILSSQASDFMTRAFRIWATQLTSLWRDSTANFGNPPQEACLALAKVGIQVSKDASGVWSVTSGNNTVTISVDLHRPYLIPLRLLQEWLLSGVMSANVVPTPPPISVVAAGMFQFPVDATTKQLTRTYAFNSLNATNTLTATQLSAPNLFLLEGNFQPTAKYIVKGTPITTVATTPPNTAVSQTFEVISPNDPGLAALLGALQPAGRNGIVVRVIQVGSPTTPVSTGFMVEISQIA